MHLFFAGVGKQTLVDHETYTGKVMYCLNFYGGINNTEAIHMAIYDDKGKLLRATQKRSKRAPKISLVWPKGKAPLGSPPCGWDRSKCDLILCMYSESTLMSFFSQCNAF